MSKNNDPFLIAKEWLTKNGGYVHPNIFRREENGIFGIFASSPIAMDEKIIQIPAELCLSSKKIDAYPIIEDLYLENLMDKVVAIFLAEYQNQDSIYRPWFGVLPTLEEFKSFHPYFCSKEELNYLETLCPRIVTTLSKFQARVDSFMKVSKERFPRDQVEWAYVNYLTRAFENEGFVPFCDLFNHSSLKGRGIVNDCKLLAGYNAEANQQIFISYGSHYDSLELFMAFGFHDLESPATIGCSTIKTSRKDVNFDRTTYITKEGPSKNLKKTCEVLGGDQVYQSLKESFKSEIDLTNANAISPITKIFVEILKDRLELLK